MLLLVLLDDFTTYSGVLDLRWIQSIDFHFCRSRCRVVVTNVFVVPVILTMAPLLLSFLRLLSLSFSLSPSDC
jgi:hypothetical protein